MRNATIFWICLALALNIAPAGATNVRSPASGSHRAANLPSNTATASIWSGMWACWDASNPNPCHHTLQSAAFVLASDGWAVGDNGLILRSNGAVWRSLPSPTGNDLRAIAMVSASDGWAVGDATILHWNGQGWASFMNPAASLYAVAMVSASEGWAVGGTSNFDTAIFRWNGSAWAPIAAPNIGRLTSIAMVSATDGWAVSGSQAMLHWNGQIWSRVEVPGQVTSVAMLSAVDGWAVGGEQTSAMTVDSVILRWDGHTWTRISASFDAGLLDVAVVSKTEAWAIGQSRCCAYNSLLRWNGAAWSLADTYPNFRLTSIAMTAPQHGYVVGQDGVILRMENGHMTEMLPPPPHEIYPQSISMVSSTDGWTVGWGGIFHWDGINWQAVPNPAGALNAVAMSSSSNGWAVGGTAGADIIHWDGHSWQPVASPTAQTLNAVTIVAANDCWAVGEGGVILHWNGQAWQSVPSPMVATLRAIAMVSATDGWAVGGEYGAGVILHWDGISWKALAYPPPANLYAVDMLSATDGWIVGNVILHWNGSQWATVASPIELQSDRLVSISMLAAHDGWAVSDGKRILHWDGTFWTQVVAPRTITDFFKAIAMVSETEGWIVGDTLGAAPSGLITFLRYLPAHATFLPSASSR